MTWKFRYSVYVLIVIIKAAHGNLEEDIDENGYILYCPCMGM